MKNYTPIAMRCNKEQFEAIKPKLEEAGIELFMIGSFKNNFYICLFEDGTVTNGTLSNREGRLIHKQWDEKLFLEACGIGIEPTYKITKETILKYNMKDEFPDAFEVKLDVGKWYKNMDKGFEKSIACVVKLIEKDSRYDFYGYGFGRDGNWELADSDEGFGSYKWVEATHQEVETALKNEAVRKYKNGQTLSSFICGNQEGLKLDDFRLENGIFKSGDFWLMKNGIWATVMPTKTIKEAEELLKELGHEIKIVS